MLTANQIRYLLIIREMMGGRDSVRSAEIARKLNVSRASVHKALESFEGKNCLGKERYSQVSLTDEGKEAADRYYELYRQVEERLSPLMNITSEYCPEICGFVKLYAESGNV